MSVTSPGCTVAARNSLSRRFAAMAASPDCPAAATAYQYRQCLAIAIRAEPSWRLAASKTAAASFPAATGDGGFEAFAESDNSSIASERRRTSEPLARYGSARSHCSRVRAKYLPTAAFDAGSSGLALSLATAPLTAEYSCESRVTSDAAARAWDSRLISRARRATTWASVASLPANV